MKFEEIREHVIGIPFITVSSARRLYDLIIEEKPKNILELGIAHGTATCYMAAAHQLGPGAIAWTGDLLGGARWKLIRSLRAAEGNDLAPPFGVRRKHTVIDDEVRIGARNQRCELFEQRLRFEDDVIGTVAPRRLEADEDSSIRSPLQAAPSDGTPCHVLPSPARSCERCPYSATP